MKSDSLRFALIGCGRMGSLWDEGAESSLAPITHASGIQRTFGAEITALCDSDPQRLIEASRVRGVAKKFLSVGELLKDFVPDVAILSTPSAVRISEFEKLIASGCKTIVCEKPLASTLAEALKIKKQIEAYGVRLVVNYSRGWASGFRRLNEQIRSHEFGAVQRVVGYYGKGLSNNGSHQIDLVSRLVGSAQTVRSLGARANEGEPYSGDDHSLDAEVFIVSHDGRKIPFTLLATDHRAYTVFEVEIFAEKARLRIVDGGRTIEMYRLNLDPRYQGYQKLMATERIDTGMDHVMLNMLQETIEWHQGVRASSSCGLQEALRTVAVVEAIKTSETQGGCEVEVDMLLNERGLKSEA